MIAIGQPPIPLSTASRMSTSSTAKTVNYNEAGSSGDMRWWRKGIVGGGHAEWRKGWPGGDREGGGGRDGEDARAGRAREKGENEAAAPPRAKSDEPPSSALVFVRVFIRVLPGAETAKY